jgi:hypothetical protein
MQRNERRWLAVLFLFGLAVSVVMITRYRVFGDELNMLARGWLLVREGRWVPYGIRTSAGGKSPGGLTALMVGAPLLLWCDYRAPVVFILLLHVAAYGLLDRLIGAILSAPHRLVFCVLYWLSPWRIYFSGHLWDPNYLFFFAAVHAWTSYRLRHQPRFWATLAHVCAIGFPMQLHASGFVLPIVSVVLLYRRRITLHWGAVLCGGTLVAGSLVPWLIEAVRHPRIIPGGEHGFPLRGLLLVLPVVRGILYWLRYSSFALPAKLTRFDFGPALGPALTVLLAAILWVLTQIIGQLTFVPSACANWWFARRVQRGGRRRTDAGMSDRRWFNSYVTCTFVGAMISVCVSPTTIMFWQGLVFFHAAVLPFVLWVTALQRSRLAPHVRLGARLWVALCVVLVTAITFGNHTYRPADRAAGDVFAVVDHPMLHELGLVEHGVVVVDATSGYRPDVFRP